MDWRTDIQDHYHRVWGMLAEQVPFSAGPISQLPGDFCLLKFPPHDQRNMWTYATCCMSQQEDQKPIELHMFSPAESDDVAELLVVTAHFHRTGAKLDLGHSVNFGRPWLRLSGCTFGLVSLPYLDGPDLENLKIGHQNLKFYWLVPVTGDEVAFKKRHGLEALEVKFDKAGLEYLNPERLSFV